MTGPDPQFITQADWKAISELLRPLWMILGAVLGLGFSFLTAHGIIPSLAATRELPSPLAALRVPLYLAAIAFLLFGLFSVTLFVDRLDIIRDIFWRGAQ